MRDLNRISGCLLGGAAGDALGYAVEFMKLPEIISKYGENGITEYDLEDGVALISDDTQMSLFTATGLLAGQYLTGFDSSWIYKAYIDWVTAQIEDYPIPDDRQRASWLVNFPEFFSPREPGRTCIRALCSGNYGTIEHPINFSKGCGGVMRVAPIGVYMAGREDWDQKKAAMLGAETAALTHGHELGYIPAAALVHIVYGLAERDAGDILSAVQASIDAIKELFPVAEHLKVFTDIMELAIGLSHQKLDDREAIQRIGEGWVAEETLAIAVYCALKYPHDFEKAIVTSVNHDGDSDSTGAVTGNIMGTALGADAIPAKFLEKLELRDIIEEVAEDLYNGGRPDWKNVCIDSIFESKYARSDYDPEKRKLLRMGKQ